MEENCLELRYARLETNWGGDCLRYAWLRIKGPFDVMRKGGTA